MKHATYKVLVIIVLFLFNLKTYSQIGDIKDLASGTADLFSGCSGSDVSAGCDAMNCCWNGGYFFIDFIIDHHQEILNMRYVDPCLLSLDLDLNAAFAIHYSQDSGRYYNYVNMLPHVRGNLGVISVDFRYNILTEYTNDFPDSYKSWDLLLMLNFVPANGFKMCFGSGVYSELYTGKYYNEHYFNLQFGLFAIKDFIDADTRVAVDYSTSQIPFLEAGLRYKMRFINFDHVSAYLTLGGIYQNYYQSHEIWAGSGGIVFNIH